jgi:TonB-dependent SusC/RagA subfamily outer membrane receptor
MFAVYIFLVSFGCSTTNKGMTSDARPEKVYTTLLDRLRDQSELTIGGSENDPTIRIRGNTTLQGDNEPLFVLNGNPVGTGYTSVSYSVDVNNVASIRVLTRSQAGLYGARGANGVVVITTK